MTAPTLSPNSGPLPLKLNPALPGRAAPATPTTKTEPPPTFTPYDPPLSPGSAQVFRADRARLFRMLGVRDHRRPAKLAAVLELLEDLAEQAAAVDEQLTREHERRTAAAAARPRLAGILSKRGDS